MNILLDPLPETVTIGGTDWPIETDFRTSILFELLIQDDTLADEEIIANALNLYFGSIPPNIVEAAEQIIWFYSCGKPSKKKKLYRVEKPAEQDDDTEDEDEGPLADADSGERVYSFEHDAPYIYAAFMEQYGIDLVDIPYLHWWKFRALFQSLNDNTHFSKIMGYRGMEITDKMSKEQKRYYRKMKKLYELPLSEAEVEKQNAIVNALLNGGDLTGLL